MKSNLKYLWILALILYWSLILYQKSDLIEPTEDTSHITTNLFYSWEAKLWNKQSTYHTNGYEIFIWRGISEQSIFIDIDYPRFISSYHDEVWNDLIKIFSWAREIDISIKNINDANMQFLYDIIAMNESNEVERYDFYFSFNEYRDEHYTFLNPLYEASNIVSFDIDFWNFTDTTLSKTIDEYVTLNNYFKEKNIPMNYLSFGGHQDDFWEYRVSKTSIEKLYQIYSLSFSTNLPWWDDVSYESRLEFLKNTPIQEYWDKRFSKSYDTIRTPQGDFITELWQSHTEKYWPTK